jgi:hypothetical protein
LLPAGAVAGWVLHPLESAAFPRRTPEPDIRAIEISDNDAMHIGKMWRSTMVLAEMLSW